MLRRVFSAMVAAALFGPDALANPPPDNHGHNKQEQRAAQPVHNNPSVFLRVSDFIETRNNAITAAATALLTLVTGGLVWVAYVQLRTTRRQLRAYVWLQGREIYECAPGHKPWVKLELYNSGETPAHKVAVASGLSIGKYPLPLSTPFKKVEPDESAQKTVLHPGAGPPLFVSVDWMGEKPLTDAQFDTIREGTAKRLYVFARAFYRDVFGRRRTSTYCASIDLTNIPEGGVSGVTKVEVKFEVTPVHNDAT